MSRLLPIVTNLVAVGPVGVIAAMAIVRRGRRPPPDGVYDAIIVAGCAVLSDGTASPSLRRRTEHAAALFHQGRAPVIVLSGGPASGTTEAAAAAVVAAECGVPAHATLLEECATNTAENARFAALLLDVGPTQRVLIVTDDWHLPRALRLFRNHFACAEGSGARAPLRSTVKGSLAEGPKMVVSAYIDWKARREPTADSSP